jgi:hypothetical protein
MNRNKTGFWILILIAMVAVAGWPLVRVLTARPGDVLSRKDIATVRVYSDPWWQRVRSEAWCGPVEGYTGCELQGNRLQELTATIQKPGRSQYVWQLSSQGTFKYAVEVVFRDGDRRYLTVWSGMPAGTFYGVGPAIRVYTAIVSGWNYQNPALAQLVEGMLNQ